MKYQSEKILRQRDSITTELAQAEGKRIVVKTLSLKTTDSDTLKLFEREGKILEHIEHPRIPEVLSTWTETESDIGIELKIAQSHVAGKNLKELISEGKRFSESDVRRLGIEIADILDHLHTQIPPIVHRDIKLTNLILGSDGHIYLIDFGAVNAPQSKGETVVGTFGYMPPEQYEGRQLPSNDVYALGMTLISLLTHREPWEHEKGPRESLQNAAISKDTKEALLQMVNFSLHERPKNGAEVRDLLSEKTSRQPSPRQTRITEAAVALQPDVGAPKRSAFAFAMVGLGLSLFLFCGFMISQERPEDSAQKTTAALTKERGLIAPPIPKRVPRGQGPWSKRKTPGNDERVAIAKKHKESCETRLHRCASFSYYNGLNDEPFAHLTSQTQRACEEGQGMSCNNLAVAYLDGKGVPQDHQRAFEYYKQACNSEESHACASLAGMYLFGHGTQRDLTKVRPLVERACNAGSRFGCYRLSKLARHGYAGVEKDFIRADTLRMKSCGMNVEACHRSGLAVQKRGLGGYADKNYSKDQFTESCVQGEPLGCHQLAFMYVDGEHVEVNLKMAQLLFEQACALGLEESCAELSGGVDVAFDDVLARAMTLRHSVVQNCFDAFAPTFDDDIVVRANISAHGRVQTMSFVENSLNHPAMNACIDRVLKSVKFPSGDQGDAHFSFRRGPIELKGASYKMPATSRTLLDPEKKEDVRRVMRRHQRKFKYYYEKALAKDPGLEGAVTIRFSVSPSGRVSNTSITKDSLGNADVNKCIKAVMKRVRFLKPTNQETFSVNYPLVFSKM